MAVSGRRSMVILAAAALVVGATSWLWGALDLPARWLIRGHVGDVAAVALVHAVLGLAWRGPLMARAVVTATIALAIELAQRRGDPGAGAVGELVLGNRFDPWDLLAYAIGVVASVAWERGSVARSGSRPRARR